MKRRLIFIALGVLATLSARAGTLTVKVLDTAGEPAQDVAVVVRSLAHPHTVQPLPLVEIVQEKMKFVPAIAIVTPGTKVRFTNRDAWDHHVHGDGGATFEFRIGGVGTSATPTRPAETVIQGGNGPVLLACYLHGSMQGSIYLSDSPYYSSTESDGLAQIPNVPNGPIEIIVWHPQQIVEQPSLRATLGPTPLTLTANLNVKLRKRRR